MGEIFKDNAWWDPDKALKATGRQIGVKELANGSLFKDGAWWDIGKQIGNTGKMLGMKELSKVGGSGSKPVEAAQASPLPILRSNIGVETARDDLLKRQANRQGQRNSVRAGETGGYQKKGTILQKLGGEG